MGRGDKRGAEGRDRRGGSGGLDLRLHADELRGGRRDRAGGRGPGAGGGGGDGHEPRPLLRAAGGDSRGGLRRLRGGGDRGGHGGGKQRPGESRLNLVQRNVAICKSIVGEITARTREAILIMVTNPVDVLTYVAQSERPSPRPRHRLRHRARQRAPALSPEPALPGGPAQRSRLRARRTRRQRVPGLEHDAHRRSGAGPILRDLPAPVRRPRPAGDLRAGARFRLSRDRVQRARLTTA